METRKDRLEYLTKPNIFIDGPGDYLCKLVCEEIIKVPQWKKFFVNLDNVAAYEREDFSFRTLPAMRCFSTSMKKEHESHYVNGDVIIDVIFPASIRRAEFQYLQDVVSSAMLQQFRRPGFFKALQGVVPGLNELGKVFEVNKDLEMYLEKTLCPVTRMTLNFRLDLKDWDQYLEREGRTKEDPFEVTLGELEMVASVIQGLNDDCEVEVEILTEQQIKGEC